MGDEPKELESYTPYVRVCYFPSKYILPSCEHIAVALFLVLGQGAHVLAYDLQHDLVGPAADGGEPHVSVHPADQHVVGEAHPAPELQAGVGHLGYEDGH